MAIGAFLRGDFVGVKIGYRQLGTGKVFLLIMVDFLLELSIHRFTSFVVEYDVVMSQLD